MKKYRVSYVFELSEKPALVTGSIDILAPNHERAVIIVKAIIYYENDGCLITQINAEEVSGQFQNESGQKFWVN